MIYTVAVRAGSLSHHINAQSHAIQMARLFGARLRAVSVWEGRAAPKEPGYGEGRADLARQELDELVEKARGEGVSVEERSRGEGVEEGLLAEARESDILVLGLPAEGEEEAQNLSLVRRAESSVLVVSKPPSGQNAVLVNYQGGIAGKAALRAAGALSMRLSARVSVLTVEADLGKATQLTETARQYLKGFRLKEVETREVNGASDSDRKILEAVEETGADLAVIGAEPYGFMERFFNRDVAEQVATAAVVPLFVAR